METLEQVLQRHAKQYPRMEPQDAVKLIYQNVFGGGHLIKDPAACRCALQHEYENLRQDPYAPLLETIGNGMARVMLNAIDASGYSVQQLGYTFIRSSQEHQGSLQGFLLKLDILRKVTSTGIFSFTAEELETYLEAYRQAGYPMVSHSEQYRNVYHPAYRVVMLKALPTELTIGL